MKIDGEGVPVCKARFEKCEAIWDTMSNPPHPQLLPFLIDINQHQKSIFPHTKLHVYTFNFKQGSDIDFSHVRTFDAPSQREERDGEE